MVSSDDEVCMATWSWHTCIVILHYDEFSIFACGQTRVTLLA